MLIVLVVMIAVLVLTSVLIITDRPIEVTGVAITNAEFDNDKRLYLADYSQSNTFQLSWEVYPENADNKRVEFFTSNGESIAVDRRGGKLTFKDEWVGGNITIMTEQNGYTDTVNLMLLGGLQEIEYNFDTNKVTNKKSKHYNSDSKTTDGKLVLFNDVEYTFGNDITVENNEVINQSGTHFKTTDIGETDFIVKKGDATKNIAVKVVDPIYLLTLPAHLQELKHQKVEDIAVGNENQLAYDIVMNNYYTDGNVVDPEIQYTFTEIKQNGSEGGKTIAEKQGNKFVATGIAEIEGNKVQFVPSTADLSYKISVNLTFQEKVPAIDFTFNVQNEFYNIDSHSDMLRLFNDEKIVSVNANGEIETQTNSDMQDKLVLTNNIVAEWDERMWDENGFCPDSNREAIYKRRVGVEFIGNNFVVDASKCQLSEPKYESNGNPSVNYDRQAIFFFGYYNVTKDYPSGDGKDYSEVQYYKDHLDNISQKDYTLSKYKDAQNFVVKDLVIVGNGGKAVSAEVNGKREYVGFRTMNGINVFDCNLSVTNTKMTRLATALTSAFSIYKLDITDSYFGDNACHNLYLRRITETNLTDSYFGASGNAGIVAHCNDSKMLADGITTIEEANFFKDDKGQPDKEKNKGINFNMVGDVILENWTTGNDPALVLDTGLPMSEIAQQVKMIVWKLSVENELLEIFKDILRFPPDVLKPTEADLDKAEFNLGLIAPSQPTSEGVDINYTVYNIDTVKNYNKSFELNIFDQLLKAFESNNYLKMLALVNKIGNGAANLNHRMIALSVDLTDSKLFSDIDLGIQTFILGLDYTGE